MLGTADNPVSITHDEHIVILSTASPDHLSPSLCWLLPLDSGVYQVGWAFGRPSRGQMGPSDTYCSSPIDSRFAGNVNSQYDTVKLAISLSSTYCLWSF